MLTFLLSASSKLLADLQEHLYRNGYHFIMNEDIIEIDEDEACYLKSILRDRGIGFVEI